MSHLLDKQFKKYGLSQDSPPDPQEWARFLAKVKETYDAEAQERYLLEQAMEVSSQEMRELMDQVKKRNSELVTEINQHALTTEQLRYSATHDLLTGLTSRTMLLELLGQSLIRIREEPTPDCAVLFVDLDDFKPINDSLGHEVGDHVLIEAGKRLKQACEPFAHTKPKISRIGGDEFVVLLCSVQDRADTLACAGNICAHLSQSIVANDHQVVIGCSIGIAYAEPTHDSANDILRDADIAMYQAKSSGKDSFAEFDHHMYDQSVRRLATEQELRRSIDEGWFVVYYQPKINLNTGDIEGFEALVRWDHPESGILGPDCFIGVAEETGLINALGDLVLRQVCRDLCRWMKMYPQEISRLDIAVNLSRRQLTVTNFAQHFLKILADEGVDPSYIIAEITEYAVSSDEEQIIETLRELRAWGVRVHMDDFGVGESSLGALHRLPLDTVKIDRGFIMRAQGNRQHMAIVETIVNLAHNLGLRVVAEGIERLEQIAQLQACDCDTGQGYYFARPLPAEAALQYVLDQATRWRFENARHAS